MKNTASYYVGRLYSGEMSAREESDFFEWLNLNDENRAEYQRVLDAWDLVGKLSETDDMVELRLAARGRNWRKKTGSWLGLFAASIAVIAITVLSISTALRPEGSPYPASFETSVGESQMVELTDGSVMMLNTVSRVVVDFTPEGRKIILDYGEVYLDVTKDPQRPLWVLAGDRVVTALGTQFSVFRAGDELQVAVAEGTVAVGLAGATDPGIHPSLESRSGQSIDAAGATTKVDGGVLLKGGMIAQFGDDREIVATSSIKQVERAQSWRNGFVIFDAEPLIEVIGELNRYTRNKVLIEDSGITELPISGSLRLNDVELFLSSLEDIHPVEVIRHRDRYILVGKKRKSE